jgi:hypothetical protein
MADNIKIIGNIGDVERVSRFKLEDTNLLPSNNLKQSFGFQDDYIEFFVYDESKSISYIDYNYRNFKLPSESYIQNYDQTLPLIEIDPINDLTNLGYTTGTFQTQYNFFKRKISDFNRDLFIDEISEDRTEIRINSSTITSEDLISQTQILIDDLNNSTYQKFYLLNFTSNLQQLAVNIAIDNTNTSTVLFKLYEPLNSSINVKDTLWVVEEIIEPYLFNIDLDTLIVLPPIPKLRRPNFDIEVDVKNILPTGYENYSSLISSLTGSSYHNVLNYLNDNSYDLNIDYTSFANFIHFGSAKKRLDVFNYKLGLIESYNSNISNILSSNSSSIVLNLETSSLKLKIDDIISKFDGFEHYLYFESGSKAWPKRNNLKPYTNRFINKLFYQPKSSSIWNFTHSLNEIPQVVSIYSGSGQLLTTQSSTVGLDTISLTFDTTSSGYVILSSPSTLTWYGNYTSSASNYDEENLDWLYNIIPNYIKNDPDNYQSYYDFVDMIGHYFDNMWIYITSINELYNADNNLEKGISKDIVYDALKSLGVNLYNSKGGEDFNNYIEGTNSGSITFDDSNPSMFSVTSSFLNNIPRKDLLSELYKRIYHNLPLLLKTKGTSAGLQNLITTFGVTSSIFSPKEFGGTTKSGLLKGYDNDKITIQNTIITGSVLSPYISVQQPFTSSENYTSTDLHFVDLSFSPQNQLNERISSSIALTNPTFSLDDYIGDPRLIESSSYNLLDTQKNRFISSSAAISGSAKRLDYKGFFELVKYFDNSLFKMLKDFTPTRTNTLTGITIQSPILERNKIKSFKPKLNNQNIFNANYNGPIISEDNDYHYDKIEGNKSAFYNGQLSGSYLNINNYYENSNPNPYLFNVGKVDLHQFKNTDFNVILNNVSSSLKSNTRFKIENIYATYQVLDSGARISSSAELQDSYSTLMGHKRSRYEGTKLTSLKYNTYSSQSSAWAGDVSYGKTAAIDNYSNQMGIFTQIKDNDFLVSPQKNNVAIKYLVDINGNLTELNERNKYWVDVQNMFKTGTKGIVSLFDSQKFANQKVVNGSKLIHSSGYDYSPIVYNSTNERLYFKFTPDTSFGVKQFKITTKGGLIKGGSPIVYPIVNNNVYSLFGKSVDLPDPNANGNFNYSNNGTNPTTFSSYTIDADGPHQFSSAFTIGLTIPNIGDKISYQYNIKKNGTILNSQVLDYTSRKVTYNYIGALQDNFLTKDGIYTLPETVTVIDGTTGVSTGRSLSAGTIFYQVTMYSSINSSIINNVEVYSGTNPVVYFMTDIDYNKIITATQVGTISGKPVYDVTNDFQSYTQYREIQSDTTLANRLNFNISTEFQNFKKNDVISFELIENNQNPNNYTASIAVGGILTNQQNVSMKGTYPYVTNVSSPFIYGSTNSNTIILNSELSSVVGYQFVPNVERNESSLYNTYRNIEYDFNPLSGDVLVLHYTTNNQPKVFESTIIFSYKDSFSRLNLILSSPLPSNLAIPNYFNSTIDKFLILKRVKDENNIVLTFDKDPGETSLGFIIPENINPDILKNIDVITKEVKQKLIDMGTFDGGTF